MSDWQVTQNVDGATGAVSWRIFRYIAIEGDKTREYGQTEKKGILEFVNREQAQSVCDSWNGYAYVADDSGDIKVRQREQVKVRDRSENNARQPRERVLIRPRNEKMTPEALAALLADD